MDLEGREWDQKTTTSNGVVDVSVNVSLDIDKDLHLSSAQINMYKSAINKQLDNTLRSSSNNKVSGSVTFNGGNGNGRLVPFLSFYGEKTIGDGPHIGGLTSVGGSSVNLYTKDGKLASPEEVAEIAVHELLHTLRLIHLKLHNHQIQSCFKQAQGIM
jgi:hypothetical protein